MRERERERERERDERETEREGEIYRKYYGKTTKSNNDMLTMYTYIYIYKINV